MKKINVLLILALLLISAKSAFALQCKSGNAPMSEECWTEVKVSSVETVPVIAGTVLEFDATTDTAIDNAYIVRVANASADNAAIAGIAQGRIATGDYGRIMVRGKGKVRKSQGAVSTRDYLYAAVAVATQDNGGVLGPSAVSGHKPLAFSLQTQTDARATIDAYIVVV